MKKLHYYRIWLLAILAIIANSVFAQTFVDIDGIRYLINDSDYTAEVVSCYENVEVILEEVKYLENSYKVKSIAKRAFGNNTTITSITIPNSIITIGEEAFYGCKNLVNVNIGNSVITIGDGAFTGCWMLQNITIPNGVQYIGNKAFWACQKLENIVLPNSITTIGNFAFYLCVGLSSINIPNSVKTIGDFAFSTTGIKELYIPESVISIGVGITEGCNELSTINVSKANRCYDSRDESNSIIETASNKLVSGCKTTIIPNTVEHIGDWAFSKIKEMSSINIPSSVLSIGAHAFYYCEGLKSVHIVDLEAWLNIKFILDSEGANEPGDSNPLCWGRNLYLNGSLIEDLIIPNSVSKINDYQFFHCNLKSVVIPNTVLYIGKSAFENCNLNNVEIANSVTDIDSRAFFRNNIDCINLPNSLIRVGDQAFEESGLRELSIPSSVIQVGDRGFSHCDIKSLVIPKTLTQIGSAAFVGNYNLSSILVEDGNESYDSRDNCNAIIETTNNKLILGCSTTIIPPSVVTIGVSAYEGCSYMKDVSIPNTVKSIEDSAFKWCSEISNIIIPNSISIISSNCFESCLNLASIDLPNSITKIEPYSFSGCRSLNIIKIPKSVSSIADGAFYGAFLDNAEICVEWDNPLDENLYISNYLFGDVNVYHNAKLLVPVGTISLYQQALPWSNFINIEEYGTITKVNEVSEENAIQIYVEGSHIMVKGVGNDAVDVYGSDGAVIYHGIANNMPEFAPGIFIVRVGEKIEKVIITQ